MPNAVVLCDRVQLNGPSDQTPSFLSCLFWNYGVVKDWDLELMLKNTRLLLYCTGAVGTDVDLMGKGAFHCCASLVKHSTNWVIGLNKVKLTFPMNNSRGKSNWVSPRALLKATLLAVPTAPTHWESCIAELHLGQVLTHQKFSFSCEVLTKFSLSIEPSRPTIKLQLCQHTSF